MSKHINSDGSDQNFPEFLKQGQRARLFPTVADTSRENRLLSIFLALLPHSPTLAQDLFSTIGLRVGMRANIECWIEVVPAYGDHLDKRPDGLIVVKIGKRTWSALVEAKIKKSKIDVEQVTKYLRAAKECGIDAVITISNEFVARADQSPVKVDKRLLNKTDLFHWSWTYIHTRCEILFRDTNDDSLQAFLLNEFLRLLDHKDTGVERFTAMNSKWREIVQTAANQGALKKNDPDVEECVGCWYQEERDLSLQLSRHVGAKVNTVIGRKFEKDPNARLKEGVTQLVENRILYSSFRVPDCAANLEVCAHLIARTLTYSMKLRAPLDRKSSKARVNWLLRMLPDNDNRLFVRAHWPGRGEPTFKSVEELRDNPSVLSSDNSDAAPHSFEVLLIEHLKGDFSGNRKFIERVEGSITQFYDLVGQHLRAWQAPPPKPVKPRDLIAGNNDDAVGHLKSNDSDADSE